jgi:hypothetical protein
MGMIAPSEVLQIAAAWIMVLVLARAADMGGSVTDAVNSFM